MACETRWPVSRPRNIACCIWIEAALSRNQPINATQSPPPRLPLNICQTPVKMSKESKEPTDGCCDECRPVHVSCDRPHDGPQDATAIERVPGYQVEQHQGHIDVGQIFGQTQQELHASN